jgi:hypothetical protein
MGPVLCDTCGERFPAEQLSQDAILALHDRHLYEELAEELRMLHRIQDFYRRHPGMLGRIQTHYHRIVESNDPCVREKLAARVPIDDIELPPAPPLPAEVSTADMEIVEYLKHHDFSLGPRLAFVSQKVGELRNSLREPPCLACQTGHLQVDPSMWDVFASVEATTWLWPEWHYRDDDGTLHIKATGWTLDGHWTGEQEIRPDDPAHEFLCWLVTQKEYHRLVDEKELPAIRQAWSGRQQ